MDKHRSTAATKGEDIKKGFIIFKIYLYPEVDQMPIVWHFDISVQIYKSRAQQDNLVLSCVIMSIQ